MSLVYQNIDPPPPSPPGECVPPPPNKGRGYTVYTLARRRGGWGGGSIVWKTRDVGLPSYSNNLSTHRTLRHGPQHGPHCRTQYPRWGVRAKSKDFASETYEKGFLLTFKKMFRKLEYLIQLRENGATFVDVRQFQIFEQITQIFGKFDSVTRKWIHFRRGVEIPDFVQ